jgi:hypothetical protein
MVLDKNILTAGILLVGVYIFSVQSLPTALASTGLSIALYAITRSEGIVMAFLLATLFVKQYAMLFKSPEPVGIEAFQVRDAPSIHTRLQEVRTTVPKVQAITGVLESPSILDSMPLQPMDQMMKDGVPCTSIPASAKARVLIYPKAEGFVPMRSNSIENTMREAPYLHGGMDDQGVNDALAHDISEAAEPEINSAEFASSEPMQDA